MLLKTLGINGNTNQDKYTYASENMSLAIRYICSR